MKPPCWQCGGFGAIQQPGGDRWISCWACPKGRGEREPEPKPIARLVGDSRDVDAPTPSQAAALHWTGFCLGSGLTREDAWQNIGATITPVPCYSTSGTRDSKSRTWGLEWSPRQKRRGSRRMNLDELDGTRIL